jgi:dTDP-4-dehydrorhamnose reductase
MLGTEFSAALLRSEREFVGTDREVDILDTEALKAFTVGKKIDWIVNCAAYTAVDKAEDPDQRELCRKLNTDGPGNIAALAAVIGAKILHISTDYVFGGKGSRPFVEADPISPVGVYASTKAEGEVRVRKACAEHLILRTAWLYGAHGPNFVYTMLRLMATKEKVSVVGDQLGTPTWARDLSDAIVSILSQPKPVFGTFHYTNLGETNWYEFALEIQRLAIELGILSRRCPVDRLTTDQYPSKAVRPPYSVLSKEKIRISYNLDIPEWKASLEAFLGELVSDESAKRFYAQ